MDNKDTLLEQLARQMANVSMQTAHAMSAEDLASMLQRMLGVLKDDERKKLTMVAEAFMHDVAVNRRPEVTEVRPKELECDVVRFQNNKDKWVALVGLLDGYPYEIFTGLQDDEEGIFLPKSVTKGKIIKQQNEDD